MPDWHCVGTNLVRTNPPITFVFVNFLWSQLVCMIFVRKIIHLATKIFGSTNLNHIPAEFVISYKSVVDTLEVLLFALLLGLMGDVVFPVSRLLTVVVRSPFLYIVVRKRKEVHRVLDEFLIFLYERSARTCNRRCRRQSMIDILCTVLLAQHGLFRIIQCFQLHEKGLK